MLIPGASNTDVSTNIFLKQMLYTWRGLGRRCLGTHLLIISSRLNARAAERQHQVNSSQSKAEENLTLNYDVTSHSGFYLPSALWGGQKRLTGPARTGTNDIE